MEELENLNIARSSDPIYLYNANGDRIDVSMEPALPNQDFDEYLEDTRRKGKEYSIYEFQGVRVPRVTSILKYMDGDNDGLNFWAANLGKNFYRERERIRDIGTKLHEAIAEYLSQGTLSTIQHLRGPLRNEVLNCFRNFLAWYNHVKRIGWKVEVICTEFPLVTPWYGGTTDLIARINGRKYVIDFKTSKSIDYKYIIQTVAYKWAIDNYYPEIGPIDGVGIIRFDKKEDVFEDIFLDVSDPYDLSIMNHCLNSFTYALNLYYSVNVLQQQINSTIKSKTKNSGSITKNTPVKKAIVKSIMTERNQKDVKVC